MPPSYAWKFSMKEFFWSTKVFSNEIFQYSETKTDGKSWFPPPLIQTFSIPEIIATVKDSSTKISGTETKNFRRKILIHPPPSFIQIFSGPEVSETLKDSPTKFFGTVRQKNFDRKSWKSPPPLIHKLFRYRKISETQHRRVHLPNLSALWDKKLSTEKRDTP